MTGRPRRRRFSVVTTRAKRSRGREIHHLVANDGRREGVVVHAIVSRATEEGERRLRLERLEIRFASGMSTSNDDVAHLLCDPRWIRALLRAVAVHLDVETDPRAIDTRSLGEGAGDPLRTFWKTLQLGEPEQTVRPPLPAITEEVIDQLMEEIGAFLSEHPDRKPDQETE